MAGTGREVYPESTGRQVREIYDRQSVVYDAGYRTG